MNIEKSLKKIIRRKELKKKRRNLVSVIIAILLIFLFVTLVINSVTEDIEGSTVKSTSENKVVYSNRADSFSIGYMGNNILTPRTGNS